MSIFTHLQAVHPMLTDISRLKISPCIHQAQGLAKVTGNIQDFIAGCSGIIQYSINIATGIGWEDNGMQNTNRKGVTNKGKQGMLVGSGGFDVNLVAVNQLQIDPRYSLNR